MTHRCAWLAAILLGAATGCGGSTTVKGKVTSGGKPVVRGSVILVDDSGQYHQGPIDSDGTYEIANVPPGAVKIGVTSPKPSDGKRGGPGKGAPGVEDPRAKFEKNAASPPPPPGAWFPLPNPDKSGDPLQSGLSGEVKSGRPLDIDVK